MNSDDIRKAVLECLSNIAPEADSTAITSSVNFRDQLDLDSVDMLNFVISLHKRFKVDIHEKDYPGMMTLDGCVAYLGSKIKG